MYTTGAGGATTISRRNARTPNAARGARTIAMKRNRVRVTLERTGTEQEFTQSLKMALKVLYRRFGLRCVSFVELPAEPSGHQRNPLDNV
jgi:hypothetical protein